MWLEHSDRGGQWSKRGQTVIRGQMNLEWKVIRGSYTEPFLNADGELITGVRVDPERPVRS